MSLTVQTITHTFLNADTTPASGTVSFRLSKRMTNGNTTVIPTTVVATLNASGQLSQALYANTDATTFPGDAQWIVTIRLLGPDGSHPEEYAITVPSTGGPTIDLGTLLPTVTEIA